MIITTWKKIEYGYDNEPTHSEWNGPREPDSEYWELENKNPKWKLISTCFDHQDKIIYYSWELV